MKTEVLGMEKMNVDKETTTKQKELELFENCLFDFWGEEPTKKKIVEAWKNYLDTVDENYNVDKKWYTLTMEEKKQLYKVAGLQ